MSNRTFVCFDCRTTERVATTSIAKACRKCRKPAHRVHCKFKIPKRADDGAWANLEARVRPMNRELQTHALEYLREKQAKLERLLAEVPAENDMKRKLLKRELRSVASERDAWKTWSAA